MSLKVVVFNGPPRSAKDTAANHLVDLINSQEGNLVAHKHNFKDQLVAIAAKILGKTSEGFMSRYDERTLDVIKDPTPLCNYPEWYKDYSYTVNQRVVNKQYSKREWLIYVSEEVIKPFFGDQAFGHMFVNSLPEEGVVFCGDSGFAAELQPVIDHVGVENVLVVRIQREGCTFEGDSRSYLDPDMFEQDVKFIQILNNGTENEFKSEVEEGVGAWMNESL